jgi:hypothetical protein
VPSPPVRAPSTAAAVSRLGTRSLASLDDTERAALAHQLGGKRSRARNVGCLVEAIVFMNAIPLTEMIWRDDRATGMLVGSSVMLFCVVDGLITSFRQSYLARRSVARTFGVAAGDVKQLQAAAVERQRTNARGYERRAAEGLPPHGPSSLELFVRWTLDELHPQTRE